MKFFCVALTANLQADPTQVHSTQTNSSPPLSLSLLIPEVLVLGNSKASLTIVDFYQQQQTLKKSTAGAFGVINSDF